MGSQWPTMGKSLMEIPIFAESVQRSHDVLQSKRIDLIKIITDDDPQMFDNILNSFVGIAAIQIALVDLLRKLKIEPDGIVGHSVGELGCAYADGCLTAEQMLLAAYYRGLVSLENVFIHGTMAAVGESFNVVKDLLPPEIDIACHNGPTSCTISGPTEIVQDFIKTLQEKKIFVQAVNTSNIAYHSRYIAPAEYKLMSYLKKVIPDQKLRSKKWICTSAPEQEWDNDKVKYSSAEYYTNNLLSTVYFEESYHHVPDNAITIEIAPHSLLNAILKRSLPNTVDNLSLTMRNNENSVLYLLNAFGRLYEMGCAMKIGNLYPPVEFPVSRSTPMISPLIKWQHTEQWHRGEMHTDTNNQSTERKFVYTAKNEDTAYIQGHIIDERNLYPAFGYLWLVVETISMIKNKSVSEVSVAFENVYFEHALTVPQKGAISFLISVHERNQSFEVRGNGAIVATGKVRILESAHKEMIDVTAQKQEISYSNSLPMNKDDFYKELRLRGYNYTGSFKNVEYVDCDGKYGEISWSNNFVCFMDGMAQITLLQVDTRDLLIPTFISKVVIDFAKHYNALESLDKENPKFPVHFHPYHNLLCSGGIQMSGWKGSEIARQRSRETPVLEKHQFVPYISDELMNLRTTIRICVEMALKNTNVMKAITYEVLQQDYDPKMNNISSEIADTLNDFPLIEANVNLLINSETVEESNAQDGIIISNEKLPQDRSAVLIALSNIHNQSDVMKSILDTLRDGGFIITRESTTTENVSFEHLGFNVCFSRKINDSEKIILLNKITNPGLIKQAIRIKNSSYSWISEIQDSLPNLEPEKHEKLIVYAEKEPTSGILGLFNCLKKEEKGTNVRCFFILDPEAPAFSLHDEFYKSQFDKNLNYNIYKDGKWGSYWNLETDELKNMKCAHAFCTLEERGNLSSFKWVEDSFDPSKNSNTESIVNVYYSSLNFKDVMLSVARISLNDSFSFSRLVESYLGCEFSGKNQNGDRLMGIVRGKGIATLVESLPYLTWPVPDQMSLEEGASIPVVYATVIYAFFFKMKLKEGSSVLIHSGSGGIGQAAINICLHYKCNIFTTVGTPEKVEFIRKTFPQIPESHVGNSRDTSFRTMIMEQTKGKGVDVVLNSLAEDKLRASVCCVAKGGHFLEIGKFDMVKNNLLELGHFLNDIVFYSVQLDVAALNSQSETTVGIFNKLKEMLEQGIIKPIQRTIFQTNEVESAFRFMASGKHIGKIVIKIRDEESDLKAKPTSFSLKAKPRVLCQENKSYVVLGGLGGFGMEFIDWLITRGARNIIITSRTGVQNGYQSYRIKLWRSYGAKIVISTVDITKKSEVKNLLEMANALGSVAGIFNLAVILKDVVFSKQTEETFTTVVDPKAIATDHLDQLSRKMCPYLEHFVVFSSVISSYGNAGQTNYGFANSITERICEARHADNLPALAIQWGALGEVGIVSEFLKNNLSVTIGGYAQQKVKSCLETLNHFMKQKNPVVCSRIVAEKRKTDSDIITTVANALGIKDIKTISLSWTLPELGMDSILGMELKQILEAEFNIFLTPEDLRTMTFAKLYKLKEGDKNALNSGTAHRTTTQLQFFMNEEISNQLILRIPLLDGKMQEPISIDENPTVFVFPGIEGLALTMDPFAKNLPVQVLCFQYHFVEAIDFIRELSNHFSSYILEKLGPEQKFHIIGHSFGTAIAVEVAEILEKQGRTGHIWLLDSSPTVVKMGFAKKMEENALFNDEMIQNQVCIRVVQTFMPELPTEKYSKYIENSTSWESKKNTCFSMLSGGEKNEKFMHKLLDKSYSILKSIPGYETSNYRLQSSGVLIRCVKNELDLPMDDAYGLKQNFENPIEVYKIDEVDHFSILSHPKTSKIIMESSAWTKN